MLRNSICAGLALCAGLRSHLSTRVILGYTVCCMLYALICQRYAVELVFQMKNYFQSGRRVVCIQKGDLSPKWAPRVVLAGIALSPKWAPCFVHQGNRKLAVRLSPCSSAGSPGFTAAAYLSLSLYIYICTYTYTHICKFVYMNICRYMFTYTCSSRCVCIHTCITCIFIYIYVALLRTRLLELCVVRRGFA